MIAINCNIAWLFIVLLVSQCEVLVRNDNMAMLVSCYDFAGFVNITMCNIGEK